MLETKLNFIDYRVYKFNYESSDDYEEKAESSIQMGLSLNVSEKIDSPLNFLLLLGITLNSEDAAFKNAGFKAFLEIGGFFELSSDLTEQEKTNYLLLNGLSMLYSTARGVIAQLTCQTARKIVVPAINIAEFAQNYVEDKAKETEQTEQSSKVEE